MPRIVIVGTSCSGKTTLARKIAAITGLPHVELDALYWGANWTPSPIEEFWQRVAAQVARNEWVIDGNYHAVRDLIWPRATDLVWLNLPFRTILWQAFSRTVKRAITREELWAGNQESFRLSFFSRDSILWWVLRTHGRRTREYRQLLDSGHYHPLNVHEMKNSSDIQELLLKLGEASSG